MDNGHPIWTGLRWTGGAVVVLTGVLVALGYLAFTVLPLTGLYSTYVVLSASMEPLIHEGSVVLVTRLPAQQVRVGDVITFTSAGDAHEILTHRVIAVKQTDHGPVFQTKGDANPLPDPVAVSYTGPAGLERLAVPFAGYVLASTSHATGRAVIGVVLAAVVALLCASAWARPKQPARSVPVVEHRPLPAGSSAQLSYSRLAALIVVGVLLLLGAGYSGKQVRV